MPRRTATTKTITSRVVKEEKHKEDDHQKGEEHLYVKQFTVLPSWTKEQKSFEKYNLSEWIRKERTSVDYHEKKLEL